MRTHKNQIGNSVILSLFIYFTYIPHFTTGRDRKRERDDRVRDSKENRESVCVRGWL